MKLLSLMLFFGVAIVCIACSNQSIGAIELVIYDENGNETIYDLPDTASLLIRTNGDPKIGIKYIEQSIHEVATIRPDYSVEGKIAYVDNYLAYVTSYRDDGSIIGGTYYDEGKLWGVTTYYNNEAGTRSTAVLFDDDSEDIGSVHTYFSDAEFPNVTIDYEDNEIEAILHLLDGIPAVYCYEN